MACGQGVTEYEIREALRAALCSEHAHDPETLMLDEMVVCQGDARIDFAVVNSSILGYEIKSAYDTLVRLSRQQEAYGQVFDKMTMVCATEHLEAVETAIPDWWGIIEAYKNETNVVLAVRREPRENPDPDPLSLAQLLWRDEALTVLTDLGLDQGMQTKPRRALWERLSGALAVAELGAVVRSSIKARGNWRSDPRPVSRGAPSRLVAKS